MTNAAKMLRSQLAIDDDAPQMAADILHAAIAGSSTPLPLNGAGVLHAALAGGHGTVNGGSD